jgi:hypothetical protein
MKSPRTPLIWMENLSTNTTFIAPYNFSKVEWMIHMLTRPHCNVKNIETLVTK